MPIDYSKILQNAGIGAGAGALGLGGLSYLAGDEHDPDRGSKSVNNALLGALLGGGAGAAFMPGGAVTQLTPNSKPTLLPSEISKSFLQNNKLNAGVGGALNTFRGMRSDSNVRKAWDSIRDKKDTIRPFSSVQDATGAKYQDAVESGRKAINRLDQAAPTTTGGFNPQVRQLIHQELNETGQPGMQRNQYISDLLNGKGPEVPFGERLKQVGSLGHYQPKNEFDLMHKYQAPLTSRSGFARGVGRFGVGAGAGLVAPYLMNKAIAGGIDPMVANKLNVPQPVQ